MVPTMTAGLKSVISGRLYPRVWLVFCDHSIVGVWRTKRDAIAATRMRSKGSLLEVEYHVVGPYVLRDP